MKSIGLLTLALICLASYSNGQETSRWDFDSDLGDLVSNRGIWQWSDRDSLQWQVPDGAEGFALLANAGEGDELYDAVVDIQHGLTYEIRFFVASQYEATTTFQVQQLALDGSFVQIIDDYTSLSSPTNDEWLTVTGSLEPSDTPSRFGIFCESPELNSDGGALWGCAIDYISINVFPDSTTTGPELTTFTLGTADPGITFPPNFLDFNFNMDTAMWTLGRNNGAAWRRWPTNLQEVQPPNASYVLHVIDTDLYSGTVLAMSPRLVVGETGNAVIYVVYYLNATSDYPVYLKLRRRLSYDVFDEEPLLNMDADGNQMNQHYLLSSVFFTGLTPGEEFNLVLEANLGIDNTRSEITVSRIIMDGVSVILYEEEDFFDFSGGLVGWQQGSMDGGKWIVQDYEDIDVFLPIPQSGSILIADRFDIHSGVISIESPPIPIAPLTQKRINLRFLVRGSPDYPVLLRLTLKTIDGDYDEEPFLDLREYGDSTMLLWTTLTSFHPIQEFTEADFYQIAVEVDLGADMENMAAIDYIEIETVELSD